MSRNIRKSLFITLTGSVVLGITLLLSWLWFHTHQVAARAAAVTATKYQQLMALTPLNHPVVQAPDFHLIDQNGKPISLSGLKGKVIVLEFMDPECTDICPIVSQEFIQANRLMGKNAANVEFVGVNVNQYHKSQSEILSFSREHGLTQLSNWHFLTGSTHDLQQVWKNYGIQVIPSASGDVKHSSFMFFIDQKGTEIYLAQPTNEKTTINEWARGISYVVNRLQ